MGLRLELPDKQKQLPFSNKNITLETHARRVQHTGKQPEAPRLRHMKFTQPEVDSQLQHMEQLELRLAQAFINLRFPLESLVAVPEPAEGLDKNRRAQEEQHQDTEANVGLFLVECHNGPNIQPDV